MKIALDWVSPLRLRDGNREKLIYTANVDKLPREPGVYVFGRRFGKSFEALYVGKANKIRSRVRGQLHNNVRLMQHVKGAKAGKKLVLAAKVITRPGQRLAKVLELTERAFIRHFLSEGHDLVNKQGVRIRRHEFSSVGKHPKRFIPRVTYLERTRGQ